MITTISGYSDDNVEIGGAISDELGCYGHKNPINITASDGTEATIFYDGTWDIVVKQKGRKFIEVIRNVGDDEDHTNEHAKDCKGYSDVLVLGEGIEWVKIRNKMFS